PLPIAQRIAVRLKGGPDAANTQGGGASSSSAPAGQGNAGGAAGGGRPGGGGGGDLQQAISRMPAATLADLQKGDAVMIVATQGSDGTATVITLLGGVEPILQASPKDAATTILTPWSLSGGGAEPAAP